MSNIYKFEMRFMLVSLSFISLSFIVYFIILFSPVDWWVDYIEIEPLSNMNTLGYSIPMVTHLNVHQTVDVEYNDILRCEKGATKRGAKVVWKEQGNQSTKHLTLKRSDGMYFGDWDFQKRNIDLDHPDICYIESNIKVTVWPGVVKYIEPHISRKFYVVEANSE